MGNMKKVENDVRLRNLKRARLKKWEIELDYYINHDFPDKLIAQKRRDIFDLRNDIRNSIL